MAAEPRGVRPAGGWVRDIKSRGKHTPPENRCKRRGRQDRRGYGPLSGSHLD